MMLLASMMAFSSCDNDERDHTLKVYNWADYIDEDLLGEFETWYEEQTGEPVRIIYQLFDINEIMLSKIEMGHEDFDVVCPSDYIIERMLRKNLLIPLNKDYGDTPDYTGNVSPFIQDLFKKIDADGKNANDYAVCYMWGTTGFLYNTKFVTEEEVSTWGAVENPKIAHKIFMKDAFRDVYSPYLMYLKQDEIKSGAITRDELMFDSSDESIALVENYLKSIRDNVSGWEQDFGKELMTKETAWVNLTWSGDATWSIEEAALVDVPLAYTVPKEGSNVWYDGWVIPKYARNVKAANYFINFLCMKENALRNMDAIGYVSSICGDEILEAMEDPESYDPVDASYFFGPQADSVCLCPTMYADRSVIERCTLMHDSGERTEQLMEMWSRVKGDNADSFSYVFIIVLIVVMAAGGIYRKRKRSMKRRKF